MRLAAHLTHLGIERGFYVGCGGCPYCRASQACAWSFRLQKEFQRSCISAFFLTLTFDDDNLIFDLDGNPTFEKSFHQKFIKLLRQRALRMSKSDLRKSGLTRKQVRSFPIRYYLISEYGTKWLRPHYHVILFNLPSVFASSEYLSKVWGHGNVDVGQVTPDSIAYVTVYRIGVPRGDDYTAKYGTRMRPYSCMSKGLGSSYISTVRKLMLSGSLPDTVPLNGKLVALPSYYLRKVALPVVARANRLIDASNRSEQRLIAALSDRYYAHGGSDDRPLFRYHESFLNGAERLLNAKERSHSHF